MKAASERLTSLHGAMRLFLVCLSVGPWHTFPFYYPHLTERETEAWRAGAICQDCRGHSSGSTGLTPKEAAASCPGPDLWLLKGCATCGSCSNNLNILAQDGISIEGMQHKASLVPEETAANRWQASLSHDEAVGFQPQGVKKSFSKWKTGISSSLCCCVWPLCLSESDPLFKAQLKCHFLP